MKHLLLTAVALTSFASNFAHAGSSSSPETRGYVMEDGRLVDGYSSRAAKAARAVQEAEAAQRAADRADRPALAARYIARYGRGQWDTHGAWKTTAELRKTLGAIAAVGVVAAAVGVSGNAEAATVKVDNKDQEIVTAPASYQSYSTPQRRSGTSN